MQLAEAGKRALGDNEGITLMELLPPVGWADVATKHDLLVLEGRIDARFERFEARMDARFERMDARFDGLERRLDATLQRQLRIQTWRMFTVNAAAMSAVVVALIALAVR